MLEAKIFFLTIMRFAKKKKKMEIILSYYRKGKLDYEYFSNFCNNSRSSPG